MARLAGVAGVGAVWGVTSVPEPSLLAVPVALDREGSPEAAMKHADCPGPDAPLKCPDCGGCCWWFKTPHLTAQQRAALVPGFRFGADMRHEAPSLWQVVGVKERPADEGRAGTHLAVRPLGEMPRGNYWYEVSPCGALHYWYELKDDGHQGGCGGTRYFEPVGTFGQAVLL